MGFAGNNKEIQGEGLVNEEIGIMVVPSYDYYDDDSVPEVTNPWIKDTVYNVNIEKWLNHFALNLIKHSLKC